MTEKEALEKMWEDIRLRGLSESTYQNYTRDVRKFISFCNLPIESLDERDVRRFLNYLITEKKLAPRTINQHSSAIRFFFAVGLNRHMNYNQIPMLKIPKKLPNILTREEISALMHVCSNTKHKALLLLAYGSGLRSSEITTLLVTNIDSKEMRIFVKGGKNQRDHFTILSQTTLNALREYWRIFRPNSPDGFLFPGTKNVGHMTRAGIAFAFETCVRKTSITKEVSVHSLRHAFGTHLYEDGVELIRIKELLGHYCIQSTTIYVHLANTATKGIISPADKIETEPMSTGQLQ